MFVVGPGDQILIDGRILSDEQITFVVLGIYGLFEVAVRTWIGPELFRMEPLRGPTDYLVIGLVALVWAVVLRYTWRQRLVERYLRLDFADPLEADGIETGGR